jgi:hypothetical protein
MNLAWSKPKYHYLCPNLLAAIERFNFESQWVGTMIMNVTSTKARAKVMAKLINIAKVILKFLIFFFEFLMINFLLLIFLAFETIK